MVLMLFLIPLLLACWVGGGGGGIEEWLGGGEALNRGTLSVWLGPKLEGLRLLTFWPAPDAENGCVGEGSLESSGSCSADLRMAAVPQADSTQTSPITLLVSL